MPTRRNRLSRGVNFDLKRAVGGVKQAQALTGRSSQEDISAVAEGVARGSASKNLDRAALGERIRAQREGEKLAKERLEASKGNPIVSGVGAAANLHLLDKAFTPKGEQTTAGKLVEGGKSLIDKVRGVTPEVASGGAATTVAGTTAIEAAGAGTLTGSTLPTIGAAGIPGTAVAGGEVLAGTALEAGAAGVGSLAAEVGAAGTVVAAEGGLLSGAAALATSPVTLPLAALAGAGYLLADAGVFGDIFG